MIVEAAIQEDADVVGLSILSGAHLELFPSIIEGLRERGRGDVTVIAGGIIPEDDTPALRQMGIKAIFGPGTSTEDIIGFIQKEAAAK
jgi:methylmalonyl-CoA mutase C-terminal domain/subunit